MRRRDQRTPAERALGVCRGAFVALLLFSFAVNTLMLTVPIYMLQLFDRVITSKSVETLVMLTIAALGAFLILGALEVVRSRLLQRVGVKLDRALSGDAFKASVAHAVGGGGHSIQALRDLQTLRNFLSGHGVLALFDAPWTPLFIFIILMLHPILGGLALLGAVALFGFALINEAVTRRPMEDATAASLVAARKAEATVRNADVVEGMGMLGGLMGRWSANNTESLVQQTEASARAGYVASAVRVVRLWMQILIFAVGAYLVITGEITSGAMVASALLMARALAPIERSIGTWRAFIGARTAYRRLNELFRAAATSRGVAMRVPPPEGRLSAERVVFVPPQGDRPTLKGVSFELEAGQSLAVVGPTAAGKSTLAKLIVGSWKPTAGAVRLDGADVYTWERDDFGRHVGYLPQDVELFAGTVRDNIARFSEASPEAIVTAAQMAGLHDLILHLPNGYETEIGEGGEVLSGGLRQRIALARALLGPPRLLVLDEPNASLDTAGEKALLAALDQAKEQGITAVVVAHRPSIVEKMDRMLVLRDGFVESFGLPAEVMEKAARPARLSEIAKPRLREVVKLGVSTTPEEGS